MKKILIVNDGFPPHSWGGANTIVYLHAKELQIRGYEVRVFTTTQDTKAPTGWGEYEGVPVFVAYTNYHPRWAAYRSLRNPQVLPAFERELRRFAPEVVHFHNIHNFISYRAIAISKTCLPCLPDRQAAGRVFLTTHDVMSFAYQKLHNFIDYSSTTIPTSFNYHVAWWVNFKDARLRFNPFRNLIIRKYFKKVGRIFAVSEALGQALADNGIKGNVSVVHNGIDIEQFQHPFDEHALRAQLNLENKKILLFVGRFTPDKGRDVTLRAFAAAAKSEPEARLLVVGFDPTRTSEPVMEKLIDELRVREKIVFVPAVLYSEMYKYYHIADIVIVPSIIFDSFPTANLEAMAAGRPVVATCFGGSREAVEDSVTGYVVNPLDVENLAQKILFLLQHPGEAEAMGTRGRIEVQKLFSVKQMVDGYEAQYRLANG